MVQDVSSLEQEESRRYGQLQIARMQMAQQQEEEPTPSQEREGMTFRTFLFFLIPSIIADAVDIISGGTIGWVVGMIVDIILLIGLGLSKGKKKSQVYKILAGFGLETVLPILDMLPFRTVFIIWAYVSEKPQVQKVIGTAAKVLQFAGPEGNAVAQGLSAVQKASARVEKTADSDTMEEAA